MSTHINAYYEEVELAKAGVEEAEGRLVTAETALEAHPDFVKSGEVAEAKPKTVARSAEDGKFVTKEKAKKSPKTTVTEKIKPKSK